MLTLIPALLLLLAAAAVSPGDTGGCHCCWSTVRVQHRGAEQQQWTQVQPGRGVDTAREHWTGSRGLRCCCCAMYCVICLCRVVKPSMPPPSPRCSLARECTLLSSTGLAAGG
jgi:hypothetical protein